MIKESRKDGFRKHIGINERKDCFGFYWLPSSLSLFDSFGFLMVVEHAL